MKRFSIPKERPIKRALRSFTIAERTVFNFFVIVFVLSGLALLWQVNSNFLVRVPILGGHLSEGVIGNPRFINPVLALSEADKNLTALIYSGLMRVTAEGEIVNDLADDLSISDDELTYTAHIREGAIFQDGELVTADDVLFTVQKVTDPLIKSPKRGNWEGVTVEKVDDNTIMFTLKKPYAPFVDNLTLGILPKHIWKNVSDEEFAFSQYNTLPVGSGPYLVASVQRNSGGIPDYYKLSPFENDLGTAPYIKNLIFHFYPNENELINAFDNGTIESIGGISPEQAITLSKNGADIVTSPLPRIFGVFFNQAESKALLDKNVRLALDLASPKEEIIQEVLGGYGQVLDGPLPPGLFAWSGERSSASTSEERMAKAHKILADGGWAPNPQTGILEKKSGKDTISLSFSISTGDATELTSVANKLKESWTKLGAAVDIKVFETGDLNQNVIRPRKYEALLFGEVVGRDADVYPFWHSSQRNDPGLNIAMYANGRVDKLLDDARTAQDQDTREKDYLAFEEEIRTDMPAVFLYSPSYLYVIPEKIKNITLGSLATPQDRFLGIRDWYIETDKVWKIFTK